MSTTETPLSERDEIEMLLPWYVTGRLDAADKARVDAAMARDPALARQVALAREEQDQTIRSNEAVVLPRALTVERGVAHITSREQRTLKGASSGLLGTIGKFFAAPTASGVRWAATAAGLVIMIQAATVAGLLQQRATGGYETATGGGAADGSFAMVRFADGATLKAVSDALAGIGASISDGPKPGGVYIVRIGPKTLDAAARQAQMERLRQRSELIALVMPQP